MLIRFIFPSKCLWNEATSFLTVSTDVISRFNSKKNKEKTFLPVKFLFWIILWLVSGLILVQGTSSMKYVGVQIGFIRLSSIKLILDSIPVNGFVYPWLLLYRDQDVWDTIWIVDDVDYHTCFISNDGITTSALSYLTVDSNRSLESLSSRTMSMHLVWSPRFVSINCLARFITTR